MKRILIALAIASLPLAALAQTTAPGTNPRPGGPVPNESDGRPGGVASMKQLDTNNDGYISRDEAKVSSNISSRFGTLDANGDGKISAAELDAGSKSKMSGPGKQGGTGSSGTTR